MIIVNAYNTEDLAAIGNIGIIGHQEVNAAVVMDSILAMETIGHVIRHKHFVQPMPHPRGRKATIVPDIR